MQPENSRPHRTPDTGPALRPESVAVTAGRPPRTTDAPLNQPIVPASTYLSLGEPDADASADPHAGRMAYGRYGNPGWTALEDAMGALEGGRALAFSSGMAAAQAVLDLVPTGGVLVLPRHCYLGVAGSAAQRVEQGRLDLRIVDVGSTEEILAACDGADVIWMESPTNPAMEVVDIAAVAAAKPAGALFVVDNTFATPLLQRPLTLGADVVMHSATKLIGGHSDALCGMVVISPELTETALAVESTRRLHGAVPGSLETFLVLRGLRTLAVRLERAQANAGRVAQWLDEHAKITAVRYPGLPDDRFHAVAAAQMQGFGSLLAIELDGAGPADAFVAGLRLWVPATSLGGVESTLERRRRWAGELPTIPPGLVRMSVGIEHVDDLIADLEQSLARI